MKNTVIADVKVRKARTGDIVSMRKLLQDLFTIEHGFAVNAAKQERGLHLMLQDQRDRCVLVAECSGEVIGMCTMQVLISTAEGGAVGLLEDMIIAREHRGKGIGKKLLMAMEDWVMYRGLTRIQLLADATNIAALEFYKHCGWISTSMICWRKKLVLDVNSRK